jgi:hypothetical protein
MNLRKLFPVLVLLAVPLLVGSSCAFFFNSGGGSDRKDREPKKEEDQRIAVASGTFGDPPAQGVNFTSGTVSGVTGSNGEFQYEPDKSVQFSIGEVVLGKPVAGKARITQQDLVDNGTADTPAVVNITRLLLSLDSEPADDVVTIPGSVRTAAVRSNGNVASAIEYLEFADEAAFANAGSQLVAALTDDYPFTATLADADTARQRLRKRR